MSFRSMLLTLLLAFALSIFVCVLAAARGSAATLALTAGLFGVQVLFALLRINIPLWRADAGPFEEFEWAWSNTMLTALVYAWGAAAMFAFACSTLVMTDSPSGVVAGRISAARIAPVSMSTVFSAL